MLGVLGKFSMNRLLSIKNLETRFSTREGTVYAVNGVSLAVSKGETLGIVGESGCGKSVTMMSLLGLIPCPPGMIANGEALFGQEDLLRFSRSDLEKVRGAKIGIIFQDPMTSFNPLLPIGKQIAEPVRLHEGLSKKEAADRVVEMLTRVGIPNPRRRLSLYPHEFSGGMRQRAMIAMALICQPDLLIADEPTTALDVTVQAQIVELVQELQSKMGMAVIWITHDLGVVAGVADRIAVMYAGRVIEEANVQDLYADPIHPYVRGLLGSLPRLDKKERKRLTPIHGIPPVLLEPPTSCSFAPRCERVMDICTSKIPRHRSYGNGHTAACWAADIS
jgi:oligopeptide transport system ATP-binding protein